MKSKHAQNIHFLMSKTAKKVSVCYVIDMLLNKVYYQFFHFCIHVPNEHATVS